MHRKSSNKLLCLQYQKKEFKCQNHQLENWYHIAEDAKKRGTKVYHLNIGQPDIKTPQVALDAVKNNAIQTLAYARSEGSEEYRTKLANYYKKITLMLLQITLLLQLVALKHYFLLLVVLRILVTKLLYQNLFMLITMVFLPLLELKLCL